MVAGTAVEAIKAAPMAADAAAELMLASYSLLAIVHLQRRQWEAAHGTQRPPAVKDNRPMRCGMRCARMAHHSWPTGMAARRQGRDPRNRSPSRPKILCVTVVILTDVRSSILGASRRSTKDAVLSHT